MKNDSERRRWVILAYLSKESNLIGEKKINTRKKFFMAINSLKKVRTVRKFYHVNIT